MTTITIENAGKYDGQEVTIRGWLYNIRESGKLVFPIFRDGTGIIQGVCSLKENPEAFEALKGPHARVSVIATATSRRAARSRRLRDEASPRFRSSSAFPRPRPSRFQLKRAWRRFPARPTPSLDSHASAGRKFLRIRAEASAPRANFMDSQGYTLTDAPMFTPAACEAPARSLK